LQPVEPFADITQEAFHRYLNKTPHRLWFDDARYDLYKSWILDARRSEDHYRLSRNEEKTRSRVLQKFYLDEDERLCCRDDTGRELRVLRDWQLFNVASNTHRGIPHGGQEKTFNIIAEQYYGIIREEVRWLLKHCKVCISEVIDVPTIEDRNTNQIFL